MAETAAIALGLLSLSLVARTVGGAWVDAVEKGRRSRPAYDPKPAFLVMLPDLLKRHPGKIALVHLGVLEGTFDTKSAAYAEGVRLFSGSAVPFLISKIEPEPSPYVFGAVN